MKLSEREEIVKALEDCKGGGNSCLSCSYFDKAVDTSCAPFLIKDALALIQELTEEIKDLEADYDRVYEQAEADIHGNMADGGTSCHWCMDKTKADTVKRMQERLKARCSCIPQHHFTYAEVAFWIDQIAKELLEENK